MVEVKIKIQIWFFGWQDFFFCQNKYILDGRIKDVHNHVSERSGQKAPLLADDVFDIIMNVSSYYF